MYHTRVCEQLIERTAASFPCIVGYGPRQAGKSTTIHHLFKDFCPMITLDDRSDRDLALTDPHRFLEAYGWPLVIDEIQKAPKLLDEIKKQIDAQRLKWMDEGKPQKLMYILTGSNRFPLEQGITDSLAGRCGIVEMASFSLCETLGPPSSPFTPDIATLLKKEREISIPTRTRKTSSSRSSMEGCQTSRREPHKETSTSHPVWIPTSSRMSGPCSTPPMKPHSGTFLK